MKGKSRDAAHAWLLAVIIAGRTADSMALYRRQTGQQRGALQGALGAHPRGGGAQHTAAAGLCERVLLLDAYLPTLGSMFTEYHPEVTRRNVTARQSPRWVAAPPDRGWS